MMLADAHIHLFRHGYHRPGQPALFGNNELKSYEALRAVHGVELALAIGYEADGIDPRNNDFLRELAGECGWLRTLAFLEVGIPPDAKYIEALLANGHLGLALYADDKARGEALAAWPRECWEVLQNHGALVSLNSRPEAIAVIEKIVAEWPGVRFLFSHLGLPGSLQLTASETIRDRLKPLLRLAKLPNTVVKISGAYATSEPSHAYPHHGAELAARYILGAFSPSRCLWGSDFPSALEFVSFAQTVDWHGLRDLSGAERRLVARDNLMALVGS